MQYLMGVDLGSTSLKAISKNIATDHTYHLATDETRMEHGL